MFNINMANTQVFILGSFLILVLSCLIIMEYSSRSKFLSVLWNCCFPLVSVLLFVVTACIKKDVFGDTFAICIMIYLLCNVLISVCLFCDTSEENIKQNE